MRLRPVHCREYALSIQAVDYVSGQRATGFGSCWRLDSGIEQSHPVWV